MDLGHIHAFADAMTARDLETMLARMAEGVTLNTPLSAAPFRGKAAIRPVVGAPLSVADAFDGREIMQGPGTCRRSSR